MRLKPYSIQKSRVEKSPFRTLEKVNEVLKKYQKGEPIGFTFTSSLKSMGLIPRSNGSYVLGKKYI